jgi:hypothetical protein
MQAGLRFVEEGYSTDVFNSRKLKYARALRVRRLLRRAGRGAAAVAMLAFVIALAGDCLKRQVLMHISAEGCGGLEYVHPLMRRVPVLYLTDEAAVWFPRYAPNTTSTRMRSFEQSIVCPVKTPRLRHTNVALRGLGVQARQLHGRAATCAAHRIDYMKRGNCSF